MPGKRPKVLFSLSYAHGVVPGVIVAVRGQNVPFTFAVASVNNGLVAEIVLLGSLAGTGIAFQQLAGGTEFQHRPPGAIRTGRRVLSAPVMRPISSGVRKTRFQTELSAGLPFL